MMSHGEPAGDPSFDYPFRRRYETLRSLLGRNGHALQILADLEADLSHLPHSDYRIRRPIERLLNETLLMAQELNLLAHGRHTRLYDVLDRLHGEIRAATRRPSGQDTRPLAIGLDDERSLDPALVGGKSAGVASLHNNFPGAVPPAFALTTAAYDLFIRDNGLADRIRLLLRDLDVTADRGTFSMRTEAVRAMIRSAPIPSSILDAIEAGAARVDAPLDRRWAVRSSAVNEDGQLSFAGQFDTALNVPRPGLADAYLHVLASRFTDRAVVYRLACGFREVDTPMAVLFMPMIDPSAAGVMYTADPQEADRDRTVLAMVNGLGDEVVKGRARADTVFVSRRPSPTVTEGACPPYLETTTAARIGAIGYRAMVAFGYDLDIEWAVDRQGKIWLLQGRRLGLATPEKIREARPGAAPPLLDGGTTIFPGRAEGRVVFRMGGGPDSVARGAILAVEHPVPELAPLLKDTAALLAAGGSPVGHLATVLREFAVPSIFQMGPSLKRLRQGAVVSVDATKRRVFEGSRWPGIKERVLSRLASAARGPASGPLSDLVLALNLTDPFSADFREAACLSIHDVVRFIHEKSVRSMFAFGDEHRRPWRHRTRRLTTGLPVNLHVLCLDSSCSGGGREMAADDLRSIPFRAFWEGLSDTRLAWPERWEREFVGLPPEFRDRVLGGLRGPRRRGDANYLIVAADYMNFNARFAYHYAMIDTLVGNGDQSNYVHLRFHSGGAEDGRRARRARFIEIVLREQAFGVDRRGDLLTAWLRGYPAAESCRALTMLGRLTVCTRQLDVLMRDDSDVKMYARHFGAGNFQAFS